MRGKGEGAAGAGISGRSGWAFFLRLALGEASRDIVSYATVLPLLLFLAIAVYLGVFSGLRRVAALHPQFVNAWSVVLGSLIHFIVALWLSPREDRKLHDFAANAGLRGAALDALLRSSFIARQWHVPVIDLLVFLPVASARPDAALAVMGFAAYAAAGLFGFGELAFRAKAGGSRRKAEPRSGAFSGTVPLFGDIAEVLAPAAVALVLALAGADDLARNSTGSDAPDRWLGLFAFCDMVLSQSVLAASYKMPKRYFRMLPVSYAAYCRVAFAPLLAGTAAILSPLIYRIAVLFPDRLPAAFLFLFSLSFTAFACAERREANRALAALAQAGFGVALAALSVFVAPAAIAAALIAIIPAYFYGRSHFLHDEVHE